MEWFLVTEGYWLSVRLDTPEGMKEALIRFQAGKLASADDEWYRLVPESFREALSKDEVLRQSILFEILKSERDYVADMHAVNEVRSSLLSEHRC